MFYFIPAAWETEEIHKPGTGNVETSKRTFKTIINFSFWLWGVLQQSDNTKQIDITVIFICTWTGFWACWGTLGAFGSTGPPSCSCWPLGTNIGVNGLPWLGRNSWGPWGLKGPAIWGFRFTTCGVSSTSGCCCCSTYWGNNEDAWRRRELVQFAYLIWWRNAHSISGNRLPVPVLVQELPELVHSVSGSEHL